MRKFTFIFAAFVLSFALLGGTGMKASADTKQYYIGGMTAGFMLSAGGAQVIGLSEVNTEDGCVHPAESAGICSGDVICAVEGIAVKSVSELNSALDKSNGQEICLTIKRGGECARVNLTPAKDKKSGHYKIGVLIRDTVSGIGTVTYIDKDTHRFGSLGHAVTDENRETLEISDHKVYGCSVIGINKGTRGKAGELRGLFINDTALAQADKVCATGLYGTFEPDYDYSKLQTTEIASLSQATIGKAIIYSTIDGVEPQPYEIAIAKVDECNRENKNFVIKVTDERLIAETGGIVQGMSGSPIIQNGKLIGAVTHVFLNDPTRGYGIGIERMISN